MKVTIEFDLRHLDPISEDEEPPSDPLTDLTEVQAKVEAALGVAMEGVESILFDDFGWTFDTHTVKVAEA